LTRDDELCACVFSTLSPKSRYHIIFVESENLWRWHLFENGEKLVGAIINDPRACAAAAAMYTSYYYIGPMHVYNIIYTSTVYVPCSPPHLQLPSTTRVFPYSVIIMCRYILLLYKNIVHITLPRCTTAGRAFYTAAGLDERKLQVLRVRCLLQLPVQVGRHHQFRKTLTTYREYIV